MEQWQQRWISCCHPASNNISICSMFNPPWSGTDNDNPELTALSCIGSSIAGWTRIIQTINGGDSHTSSISTLTKAMATMC